MAGAPVNAVRYVWAARRSLDAVQIRGLLV
jgi:hypothetical protein